MLKLQWSRQRQKPLAGTLWAPRNGQSQAAGPQGWLWVTGVAKAGRVPCTTSHVEAETGHGECTQSTNRDLGRASQPCLPLSFSLQRESANILISSHTQTLRPDPRIHILGDLHKLPAINRAHEVQGLRASTLAKNTVQEDWK